MIEENIQISITKQAELLSVSKSSHYYEHIYTESELKIMSEIDKIYTEQPYYWSRRISISLERLGYKVWRKKTRTYMHIMGIKAIYPTKNTSKGNKEHKKYKYLLKWVEIVRINQVWSTDITYIKIPGWFVYLMAVIDWYSRYIIAWDISVSMDWFFCNSVLKKALEQWTPEIFNSDQWSQFTANEFISIIESHWIQVSMDWVGRCYDNILIERLWRTIKYEDIHIHEYQNPKEVYHGLDLYINRYNHYRLHQSLNYKTPWSVFLSN